MSSQTSERDRLLAQGSAAYRAYISAEILHGHATAEAVGLGATDFYSLNILELSGPLTAGQLAHRIGLTTGAATRMIDRLEQARFVRRVRDPDDRRLVIIEPLPDRQTDIDVALSPARRLMYEVFQHFNADQIHVLFTYFQQATTALLAATEELQARDQPAKPR